MVQLLSARRGLALVHIAFGLYFLVQAFDKTQKQWLTDGQQLTRFLQSQSPHAEGWYRQLLQTDILPHASLFARLVTLGEWGAGISLLLGVLTPLGALAGMWLVLNYMLTKGLPNVAGSIDRLFFLTCFVFLISGAGLAWGLDGLLLQRLRRSRERQPAMEPASAPLPRVREPQPIGRQVQAPQIVRHGPAASTHEPVTAHVHRRHEPHGHRGTVATPRRSAQAERAEPSGANVGGG
jgi:uncharacterized membrane protein YphA (DoxX/SURF4 family)